MELNKIYKNDGYYEYKFKELLTREKIVKILESINININFIEYIGHGDMDEEKNSDFFYSLEEFKNFININKLIDIDQIIATGVLNDINVAVRASEGSRYLKIICMQREILEELSNGVSNIR